MRDPIRTYVKTYIGGMTVQVEYTTILDDMSIIKKLVIELYRREVDPKDELSIIRTLVGLRDLKVDILHLLNRKIDQLEAMMKTLSD